MQQPHYLVPHHTGGQETDIAYTTTTDLVEEAEDLFVDAKNRLMDVGRWAAFATLAHVRFALADSHRQTVKRKARRADHILIDTGAPGTPHEEHDAYIIDALEYDDYPDNNYETFAIRMHASDATEDNNEEGSATIVIERSGLNVSAIYHGRNKAAANELWHGLNHADWQALVRGLIEYYED